MKHSSLTKICVVFCLSASAQAANTQVVKQGRSVGDASLQAKTEQEDRVATDAFKASLSKYETVLAHKKDPLVRRQIMGRIGEILFEMAGVQFRTIHAETNKEGQSQAKAEYRATLNRIVHTETTLMREDPSAERMPRYLFLLAQAYKELGQTAVAISHFKTLLDKYPNGKDEVNAVMTLHDLLDAEKDYRSAIIYLKKLKVTAADRHFPVIMDFYAFDYYYLKEVGTAIKFLEAEWKYYQAQQKESGNSDQEEENPERAKVLKNLALFYASAMDNKTPGWNVSGFYESVKKFDAGALTGTALKLFGNLLRSRGRYKEFEELKNIIVHSVAKKSDAIEFLLIAMDKELERREFSLLKDSGTLLLQIIQSKEGKNVGSAAMQEVEKALQRVTENLQKQYTTAQGPEKIVLQGTLIALYNDLLILTQDQKEVAGGIHFNLAELYFTDKIYSKAIPHYLWIFKENAGSIKDPKILQKAHYRAVVGRFEELVLKGLIPKSVKAKSIDLEKEQELSPAFVEWTEWLRDYGRAGGKESLDFYYFELIQTLYSKDHLKQSISWIDKFLEKFSDSKYFIPAASLKLDSYLLANRWDDTITGAEDILKKMGKFNPKFATNVREIAADCRFKKLEALYHNKKYADVVEGSQKFIHDYSFSKRFQDAQALAANAALGMGDRKQAVVLFAPLIAQGLKGKPVPAGVMETGLLTRASVEESDYHFEPALREYLKYLKTHEGKSDFTSSSVRAVREKALLLGWMSGNSKLASVLGNSLVCAADFKSICGRYTALYNYNTGSRKQEAKHAAASTIAFLSALLELKKTPHLKLDDRIRNLLILTKSWDAQEPFLKYATLSDLVYAVPMQLNAAVNDVHHLGKMALDKRRINERVKLIAKVEKAIEKVITLPWVKIRVSALNSWSNLYSDLAADFIKLPRPPHMSPNDLKDYETTVSELRQPFFDKAMDLRKKAFQLGVDAVVEARIFMPISDWISAEDTKYPREKFKKTALDLNLGLILMAALKETEVNAPWYEALTGAVAHHNWPVISFLVQDSTMKTLLDVEQQALARGVSLAVANCQSEALSEIRQPTLKFSATANGLARFGEGLGQYGVRAKEKTRTALHAFFSDTDEDERKPVLTPNHSAILVDAMEWSELKASAKIQDEAAGWTGEPKE